MPIRTVSPGSLPLDPVSISGTLTGTFSDLGLVDNRSTTASYVATSGTQRITFLGSDWYRYVFGKRRRGRLRPVEVDVDVADEDNACVLLLRRHFGPIQIEGHGWSRV